jgi:hypothetical protein
MKNAKTTKRKMTQEVISKNLVREILEELHILTTLSPNTLLKTLQIVNELTPQEYKIHLPEKGLSQASLYRNIKGSDAIGSNHSIRELKGEHFYKLKNHQGQLRLRIIEIIIEYTTREDSKQDYEVLRYLCSYEIKTGYFDCTKLPSNVFEITEQLIMEYALEQQNKIGIKIANVFFTQTFIEEQKDSSNDLRWNWRDMVHDNGPKPRRKMIITKAGRVIPPTRKTINSKIEQINVLIKNPDLFRICGSVKDKTKFVDMFEALVNSHQKQFKTTDRYKKFRNDTKVREKYETFSKEIKACTKEIDTLKQHFSHIMISPDYLNKKHPICFNFNLSNKNTCKVSRVIKTEDEKNRVERREKLNLNYNNRPQRGHLACMQQNSIRWNFHYENIITGTYLELEVYKDFDNENNYLHYLVIKLESGENIWIYVDDDLKNTLKQHNLEVNDTIKIIHSSEKSLSNSERYVISIQKPTLIKTK